MDTSPLFITSYESDKKYDFDVYGIGKRQSDRRKTINKFKKKPYETVMNKGVRLQRALAKYL